MANFSTNTPSTWSNSFNSRAILLLDNKPNIEFWLKAVTLPSISVDSQEITREPYAIKIEGNTLTYDNLDVSVFIDENFEVYQEIYNGFTQIIASEDSERPQANGNILIFNNQLTEIVLSVAFQDLFLLNLPSISYDNFSTTPIAVDLSMAYNKFTPTFNKL